MHQFLFIILSVGRTCSFVFRPEEQRNAPDSRQSDNGVNNSAYYSFLTSANPCNYIELEKSDTTPVKCADDGQYQCDSVKYH